MLSERSQTEKENNHMISLICGTKKRKTKNFGYRERIGDGQRQGLVMVGWVK